MLLTPTGFLPAGLELSRERRGVNFTNNDKQVKSKMMFHLALAELTFKYTQSQPEASQKLTLSRSAYRNHKVYLGFFLDFFSCCWLVQMGGCGNKGLLHTSSSSCNDAASRCKYWSNPQGFTGLLKVLVTPQNTSDTPEVHILARQEVLRGGGAGFRLMLCPVGALGDIKAVSGFTDEPQQVFCTFLHRQIFTDLAVISLCGRSGHYPA